MAFQSFVHLPVETYRTYMLYSVPNIICLYSVPDRTNFPFQNFSLLLKIIENQRGSDLNQSHLQFLKQNMLIESMYILPAYQHEHFQYFSFASKTLMRQEKQSDNFPRTYHIYPSSGTRNLCASFMIFQGIVKLLHLNLKYFPYI